MRTPIKAELKEMLRRLKCRPLLHSMRRRARWPRMKAGVAISTC